jgi:hypothetical protein
MTEDLRTYLTDYQKQNHLSRVTIDNVRRNFVELLFMAGG